ncbi:hypothetical protein B0H17DRAFT_1040827 [Mycena rosella]|uniref:Uncharacterized protein n=1 Tax=Mycena rosella TaxID=1033263 RepID=A0AAD7GNU5_MYCRO|nr:hypothetical protein B0H17DRAFT_1040827 [Mycena rosella]
MGTLTPSPPDAHARGAATVLCSAPRDLGRRSRTLGLGAGAESERSRVGFPRGWRMLRVSTAQRLMCAG